MQRERQNRKKKSYKFNKKAVSQLLNPQLYLEVLNCPQIHISANHLRQLISLITWQGFTIIQNW